MTHEPEASPRLYWPALDGLRFVAVLLVMVHHVEALPGMPRLLKPWGWVGVDLFLVLSAFLLTRLLCAEIERVGRPNLRHYFIRRICRIWPLHLGFVTGVFVYACVAMPEQLDRWWRVWISHLGFFNNVLTALHGYQGASLPYTAHLWTISLEEQYYLLVPLVVPLLVRLRPSMALAWIGAALLALWCGRALAVDAGMRHPFIYVLPLRMDAMLVGTALGLVGADRVGAGRHGAFAFLAGLGLLVFAATQFTSPTRVDFTQVPLYTVLALGCGLLVVGCLGSPGIGRVLAWPPIRYLGKVSFGLYVYHVAVLHGLRAVSRPYGGLEPWALLGCAIVVTAAISALSYELFERRFLELKRRYTTVASRPV